MLDSQTQPTDEPSPFWLASEQQTTQVRRLRQGEFEETEDDGLRERLAVYHARRAIEASHRMALQVMRNMAESVRQLAEEVRVLSRRATEMAEAQQAKELSGFEVFFDRLKSGGHDMETLDMVVAERSRSLARSEAGLAEEDYGEEVVLIVSEEEESPEAPPPLMEGEEKPPTEEKPPEIVVVRGPKYPPLSAKNLVTEANIQEAASEEAVADKAPDLNERVEILLRRTHRDAVANMKVVHGLFKKLFLTNKIQPDQEYSLSPAEMRQSTMIQQIVRVLEQHVVTATETDQAMASMRRKRLEPCRKTIQEFLRTIIARMVREKKTADEIEYTKISVLHQAKWLFQTEQDIQKRERFSRDCKVFALRDVLVQSSEAMGRQPLQTITLIYRSDAGNYHCCSGSAATEELLRKEGPEDVDDATGKRKEVRTRLLLSKRAKRRIWRDIIQRESSWEETKQWSVVHRVQVEFVSKLMEQDIVRGAAPADGAKGKKGEPPSRPEFPDFETSKKPEPDLHLSVAGRGHSTYRSEYFRTLDRTLKTEVHDPSEQELVEETEIQVAEARRRAEAGKDLGLAEPEQGGVIVRFHLFRFHPGR